MAWLIYKAVTSMMAKAEDDSEVKSIFDFNVKGRFSGLPASSREIEI